MLVTVSLLDGYFMYNIDDCATAGYLPFYDEDICCHISKNNLNIFYEMALKIG